VAGLTLGGGTGYLSRLLSTTADSLVSATVVVADGRTLEVDERAHGDLLWALRGAGHNFGVCTSFTFRTHPLGAPVFVRQAIYPADARRDLLRAYRDWSPGQPDALSTYLHLLLAPPHWHWLPPEHRGAAVVNATSVFYGEEAEGKRLTGSLFDTARPIWARAVRMRHVELQHACDDDWRFGIGHYWKPAYLSGLPDAAIASIVEWCDRHPAVYEQARSQISPQPINQFEINFRGGELARRPSDSSAYSDRTSPFNTNVQAVYRDPAREEELVAWANGFAAALGPYRVGEYTNFRSDAADGSEARRIFGDDKLDRLLELKRIYDPDGVFRHGGLDLVPAG
jgi:hypothetical protein